MIEGGCIENASLVDISSGNQDSAVGMVDR